MWTLLLPRVSITCRLARSRSSRPSPTLKSQTFFVARKRCVLDGTEAPEALKSLAASLTRWRRRGKLRIDSITTGGDRSGRRIGFQRASIEAGKTGDAIQRFQI